MSKQQAKRNSYPTLQKKIILHLAQSTPQTIHKTAKQIEKDYKSSHYAFDALRKKGLIKQVTSKPYRGREFPQFWLTELGVSLALSLRAEPQTILRRTIEIYPENRDLQFVIEAVPILGKNALDMLYLIALNKGVIKQGDLTSIFAIQMQKRLTPAQIRRFITVLKKYPIPYQQCVNCISQTRKNLRELSDLL
jgi:hypothetical protein